MANLIVDPLWPPPDAPLQFCFLSRWLLWVVLKLNQHVYLYQYGSESSFQWQTSPSLGQAGAISTSSGRHGVLEEELQDVSTNFGLLVITILLVSVAIVDAAVASIRHRNLPNLQYQLVTVRGTFQAIQING